jgi:hypothetical protein
VDFERYGYYLLVAIAFLAAGVVRVLKLRGEIAAWKIWLPWFLVCMILNAITGLQTPPFDFWISLTGAAVIAVPMSALTLMMCPSFEVRYPWTDAIKEHRSRRDYEVYLNSEFGRWFTAQEKALLEGGEIEPPWVAFPNEDPWWIGWRQGNGEGWIKLIWYPYWKLLEIDQRRSYLDRWNAPDMWREYLDPDRETAIASDDLKQSLGGFVMNLWLKGTPADREDGESEREGAPPD